MEQWADEGEKPCGEKKNKERQSEANYRNTESRRDKEQVLESFDLDQQVRGGAQRGWREEGGEVEKGADHLTQGGGRKQWADKSDKTQRERFR